MILIFSVLLVFLVIRFVVTVYNGISYPILPQIAVDNSHFYNTITSISILVPARNEEKNISVLLSNLLELNDLKYLNFEILVLDDHSIDKTSEVVTHYTESNSNIRLIKGKDLSSGWLGKNWACHQLALEAKGNFLLFIDADVMLKDGVIFNSIERLKLYKSSLLSLFPEQEMNTFGEKLIVPLMHFLLLNLLPLRAVRQSTKPSLAAANGQFMLFDAFHYRKHLFHEKVKSNVLDDVNIMRLAKSLGLKGEVLLGNNQVLCRMYTSGKEAFNGFSKNLFLGFDKNIIGFQMYFLLIYWLWIPFFLLADDRLKVLAIVLILFERVIISYLSNQNILRNLIYHPIQMTLYTFIGINSMYLHLTNKVEWKGRKV